MATFYGHLIATTFLFFFGIRWLYCVLLRYHLCRKEEAVVGPKARPFKSSLIYPMSCCPRVPIDACIILVTSIIEITTEFLALIPIFGGILLMSLHHASLVTFNVIAGAVMIAKHHGRLTIPDIDYAAVSLSMVMGSFLFSEHGIGKSPLEAKVHGYLPLLYSGIALMYTLEAKYRHNVLFSVGRASILMATGSWFLSIGFILYNPFGASFDEYSNESLKIMPLLFMWNIVFNIVGLFVTNFVALCCVRCMTPDQVREALDVSYAQASARVRTRESEHCKYLLCDAEPDDE